MQNRGHSGTLRGVKDGNRETAEEPAVKGQQSAGVEPQEFIPGPDAGVVASPRELGGPTGPEPTRFGDWERNGRCIDF